MHDETTYGIIEDIHLAPAFPGFPELLLALHDLNEGKLYPISASPLVTGDDLSQCGVITTDGIIPIVMCYELYAQLACSTLLCCNKLDREIKHVIVLGNTAPDSFITAILSKGAHMLWDERLVSSNDLEDMPYQKIAMPFREIGKTPSSLNFTYFGEIPPEIGALLAIVVRTSAREHMIESIAGPFQWTLQDLPSSNWTYIWKETPTLNAKILSFGHLDDSDMHFATSDDFQQRLSSLDYLFNCIPRSVIEKSCPAAFDSYVYKQQTADIASIWLDAITKSAINDEWDELIEQVAEDIEEFSSGKLVSVVQNIGRILGVDLSIKSYFDGVPINALVDPDILDDVDPWSV